MYCVHQDIKFRQTICKLTDSYCDKNYSWCAEFKEGNSTHCKHQSVTMSGKILCSNSSCSMEGYSCPKDYDDCSKFEKCITQGCDFCNVFEELKRIDRI
jgi:hypothetical protein